MTHRLLIAALAAATAGPALAGFVGPTDPSRFTVSTLGTLTGTASTGSANFTATQLTLVGGDASGPNAGCVGGTYSVLGPCQVQAVLNAPGIFNFHWSYVTADDAGPAGDMFGVLVDGVRKTLSDLGGPISQSGDYTANAKSSFGWFMNCTDCTGGAATAVITNVTVPEPGSLALVLAAAGGLGAARLRSRRA